VPRVYALNENSTNEPNDGQLAGNAQTMLEIKVKSETRSIAALDNVAGFGSNGTPRWITSLKSITQPTRRKSPRNPHESRTKSLEFVDRLR
jgi:hypothetical protein